jgi:hypothetical protein
MTDREQGRGFGAYPQFVNPDDPAMTTGMNIHPLITDSAALADLCARLARSPFVAVDTEFMRENTYWPDLCLIQIGDAHEAAAIDPKAKGLDLQPLLDLMVDNDDVLKVFHAGGQDLEIIHNMTGKTPYPLFDTQVAAMALGMGDQIGYSNLVESLLGVKLDKGARFTDWARRPLDKRRSTMRSATSPISPRSSPRSSPASPPEPRRLARPGDGPARATLPATSASPTSPGSASRSRAASPRCSAA